MTSLQIKPFSIQEFVGTKKLPRDAIVEIMIIHLCDKCAYLKEKYILSLEIAAAAADHLYPGARTRKTVRIAAESDDNQEVKNVPDFSHIDASIKNIEKLLDHQFSLLMRLAWRHDLIADLNKHLAITLPGDDRFVPSWKLISFRHLRMGLVELLSSRTTRLPLNPVKPPRSISRNSLSLLASGMRPSSLLDM